MAQRPLIGITMDWQQEGSFSPRPYYALRQHYFDAVWDTGGLPVALPLKVDAQESFLARIDGLLVPGGDYPSPGWWYGDDHGTSDHPRAEADVAFIRRALDSDLPLLGICAGHQTLAVATGGQLVWRVKNSVPGALDHRGVPLEKRAHPIEIPADSLLARVTGLTTFEINSHHNEAVIDAGERLSISARAPDGVIEAVELPGKSFVLGVQWHPEMFLEEGSPDRTIFEGLVAAASEYRRRRDA